MKKPKTAQWIQDTPVKGPTKAVLLSLAVISGNSDECTASITEISHTSGVTKRTVIKSLAELEAKKQVSIKRRAWPNTKGPMPNQYRLLKAPNKK